MEISDPIFPIRPRYTPFFMKLILYAENKQVNFSGRRYLLTEYRESIITFNAVSLNRKETEMRKKMNWLTKMLFDIETTWIWQREEWLFVMLQAE